MIPSALSPPDLICHCQRGQHAIRETLPLTEGLFTEKPRLCTDDRFCVKWSSQLWRHVQWLVSMSSPVTCHSFHSNLLYLKVKYCYYVIILWVTVWLYVIVNMEWEPSLSTIGAWLWPSALCELILCHSHTVRAVTHQEDISHICVFQKDFRTCAFNKKPKQCLTWRLLKSQIIFSKASSLRVDTNRVWL